MKGGDGLAAKLREIADQGAVKARVGIIESKTYPDGTPVAMVGFWNEYGTRRIPARPFFRSAIAANRDRLGQMVAELMKKHDAETAMRLACEHMVDELKNSVMTWSDPGNAPSTIAAKGYDAPLRGPDRLLRNSFSYEIVEQ